MKEFVPAWALNWLDILIPLGQILLIVIAAWLLRNLLSRLIARIGLRANLPSELIVGTRRLGNFVINASALILILQELGVSGTVLWTALTGFAAVGAVAFFAAWSVLSNIFCALLIFTTRPFRLNDLVELLENGEKPGLKGRVVDINLIYTTLEETREVGGHTTLRVPNSLFFQRTTRCWTDNAIRDRLTTPTQALGSSIDDQSRMP
jgi:small-conductance mechanosensitive channel